MDFTDAIRKHLLGDPEEQGRRGRLLEELLGAFARGGRDAVRDEVARRLRELAGALEGKLDALREAL
jgi:hypothetical protein